MLRFDPFEERIVLRVQNEQFSEEKGFILRYTKKGSTVSADSWVAKRSTTELSDADEWA